MLQLVMYSEKSFAVFGDTKAFKDTLKALNGRFNANLKGKAGWIFGLKQLEKVSNWIKTLSKPKAEKISRSLKAKSNVFDKTHEFYEQITNSKEYLIHEFVENISLKSFMAQTGYKTKDLNISHYKRIRGTNNVLDMARTMIDLSSVFNRYTESEVADIICETFYSTPTQSGLITKLIAKFEGEKENYFAEAEFLSKDCPF